MSAKLMGMVWEYVFPHAERMILLALADHGHDDGSSIKPGIDYLCWKTDYSEAQVHRILRGLRKQNILIPVAFAGGGRGHPTEYEMHLENAERKPDFERKGLISSTDTVKGVISDVKGVISDVKGVISDVKGVIAMTPEPSENHHTEPSENHSAHARARDTSHFQKHRTADLGWHLARQELRKTLNEAEFDAWLRDTELRVDPESKHALVLTKTSYSATLLASRYDSMIRLALAKAMPLRTFEEVEYVCATH